MLMMSSDEGNDKLNHLIRFGLVKMYFQIIRKMEFKIMTVNDVMNA